jgi:hypothetical protein
MHRPVRRGEDLIYAAEPLYEGVWRIWLLPHGFSAEGPAART